MTSNCHACVILFSTSQLLPSPPMSHFGHTLSRKASTNTRPDPVSLGAHQRARACDFLEVARTCWDLSGLARTGIGRGGEGSDSTGEERRSAMGNFMFQSTSWRIPKLCSHQTSEQRSKGRVIGLCRKDLLTHALTQCLRAPGFILRVGKGLI